MKKLVVFLIGFFPLALASQTWVPDTISFHPNQSKFGIKFISDGPFGHDWIVGGYFDRDSLRRCAAYRKGGKWVPAPFYGYFANMASDIDQFGDTLLICGDFSNVLLDNGSIPLPNSSFLRVFGDSVWADTTIYSCLDISVQNDSILMWGARLVGNNLVAPHLISSKAQRDWHYAYSIKHPTDTIPFPDFGPRSKLEILPNGDILTLNNGSISGSPFSGLSLWDGQMWQSFGNGLFGSTSQSRDFEFYQNELYMGGTFYKDIFPQDPGNFVVRWDGSSWNDLATGIGGFVFDLFLGDSLLICHASGGDTIHRFGDITLSYLAGWDGAQWCGTPTNFQGPIRSFGLVNDTLYAVFAAPSSINGGPPAFVHWLDGDYFKGPAAICSTLGLGDSELEVVNKFSVYPNPANDYLMLEGDTEPTSIKVFSFDGKLVQTHNGAGSIFIGSLQDGIYLIEAEINESLVRKRFVKESL